MSQPATLHIVAELPADFRLTELVLADSDRTNIHLNRSKFGTLQQIEAIIDGLSFTIQYRSNITAGAPGDLDGLDRVFCDKLLFPKTGTIAILLSDNLTSGHQMTVVNRALLELARAVGGAVAARAIIWMPAHLLIGFDYFAQAIADCRNTGSFPLLTQIAIEEPISGRFRTRGMRYFIGQEVELIHPPGHHPGDVLRILVRIICLLVAHDHCNDAVELSGLRREDHWTVVPDGDRPVITAELQSSISPKKKAASLRTPPS